jgi:DNA-binding response OmpR family regulator
MILDQVWGYSYAGDTNVVDVYIRYLRAKLAAAQVEDLIETVRGVGYVIRDH